MASPLTALKLCRKAKLVTLPRGWHGRAKTELRAGARPVRGKAADDQRDHDDQADGQVNVEPAHGGIITHARTAPGDALDFADHATAHLFCDCRNGALCQSR